MYRQSYCMKLGCRIVCYNIVSSLDIFLGESRGLTEKLYNNCQSAFCWLFIFSPDVQLIDDETKSKSSLELDEVEISNPKLDAVLKDEHWVDDATYVPVYCC